MPHLSRGFSFVESWGFRAGAAVSLGWACLRNKQLPSLRSSSPLGPVMTQPTPGACMCIPPSQHFQRAARVGDLLMVAPRKPVLPLSLGFLICKVEPCALWGFAPTKWASCMEGHGPEP